MDSFEQARRHFMEGLSSLTAGDPIAAERHFRASLERLPDRPSTLTNLSAALLQQGRLEEAREAATRAVQGDPAAADAWVNLGLATLALGATDEAQRHAERVLTAHAGHAGALALSARAYRAAGNLESAADRWQQLADAHPQDAGAWSSLATTLAEAGRIEEALVASERSLAGSPDDTGLLVQRAAVLERAHRPADSIAALRRARRHGGSAEAGLPLARLLASAGQPAEALAVLDDVLAVAPEGVEAWVERAVALQRLGRAEEALACCERAIALRPGDASVWSAKGVLLGRLKRHEEALACHRRAVELAPQAPEAWSNRGSSLHALKRHDEALLDFDEALRLRPGYAEAWTNRGAARQALEHFDEALADHDQALRLEPTNALAWSNRALALNGLDRPEEALASADRALELAPGDLSARTARAAILCGLDRAEQALPDLEEALRLDPSDADRRFDLSHVRLQCLDFVRGWADYEARFRTKSYDSATLASSRPRWDGHRSASRLLVWGEQGLGDQILHGSMLQDLCSLPQPVTVAVDTRLASLLQRSFPSLSVRGGLDALAESEYDEQVPIGSLGQTFRRSAADFAGVREAWLVPDPVRVAEVRACADRLPGLRVGVSWRSANARIGSDKSIELDRLAECLGAAGGTLVDLQYGSTAEELEACRARTGVTVHRMPGVDLREDLEGVAAIIASCDVIVTISNTVAHMAGAIGRPTWLLLPRVTGRIWYWSEVDGRSLWYPSVRILRQTVQGDWSGPLGRAQAMLRKTM